MKNNLVLILIILIFFSFWWEIYQPLDPFSKEKKIFQIKKGESSKEISINLEKEGLIRRDSFFWGYVFLKGVVKNLQAGTYFLSPSMNIPQIAEKLVKGEIIKEKITIVEGWNLRDIGLYLERKGIAQAKDFWEITSSSKNFFQEFDFLKEKPKNLSLEGYLFPDTYEIIYGQNLEEIVKKMLENFDKKITPQLREEIKRQRKTIFEIITMASMIEKEVRSFEDKRLVSGILWKRLKGGMPLQVDATITYITGKKTIKIPIEDLQIDSPYNTYKYRGLPIGPISNPGLESILASIYPKDSEYWYYLSTPEGETVFSKTLAEHNIAKAKYLK